MMILGIETSCDETSAAVLEVKRGRFDLRSHVVASQVAVHTKTGGVVPEVAAREHMVTILPTIQKALEGVKPSSLDAIGVTSGPGLLTSLLVGVETAKALSYAWSVPLVRVNHIEGHIYANWLEPTLATSENSSLRGGAQPTKQSDAKRHPEQCQGEPVEPLVEGSIQIATSSRQMSGLLAMTDTQLFPLLILVVSGGHTELILMKGHGRYTKIGGTQDDAAAVLYETQSQRSFDSLRSLRMTNAPFKMTKGRVNNIAASFQQAVVDVLVEKTIRAAIKHKVKGVLLSGGVAANRLLRETLSEHVKNELPGTFYAQPRREYCTDNAAMIAAAAYFHARKKDFTPFRKLKADANWELV
ncbi:MAG: tRNA (adenosine(37)-N6)-threonylcarbamoyltransferase complex transferase subunit TsaD [Candidatus Kerfeldbacteria bacterium]|nr:tRNA (adenosine(37)-N6)-threonylcarbamoyltransferase complex transferase subunit TsaD [Candidatus Kerfeldbacteria bacterium]